MSRFHHSIQFRQGDKRARTPGVDYGPECRDGVPVLHQCGRFLLVKIPGHTAWAGVNESAYVRTSYEIWELEHPLPAEENRYCPIYQEEPGPAWRPAVERLKARVDFLGTTPTTPMEVTRGERLVLERWRARKAEGGMPPDGREAEELRQAFEDLMANGDEITPDEIDRILNSVDARDSLGFLELRDDT